MQSLNRNGVSITQAPGEEKFVKYRPVAFKGRIFYQYDYRHTDGELFSTVAKTLAECRHRRDKWIEKKERKLPVKYVLQNRKISPDSVRFVQIRLRVGTNSIKLYQFGTDLL